MFLFFHKCMRPSTRPTLPSSSWFNFSPALPATFLSTLLFFEDFLPEPLEKEVTEEGAGEEERVEETVPTDSSHYRTTTCYTCI
mmetsp:Transcript_3861/g.7232  ORF Transcript_3861/g.7232 Transcript_3861/m.7232 type:complete len:84 (-) Transcript_3861:337-588(-)